MALTISTTVAQLSIVNDKSADRLRKFYLVTGPVSYTTGGSTFLPSDLGFGQWVQLGQAYMRNAAGTELRIARVNSGNPSAPTLQWFGENFQEIANAVDLSGYSGTIEFIGK